jgi:hypothetical protein
MRYAQVYQCASESLTEWQPYWVESPGALADHYGVLVHATTTSSVADVATVMIAIFEQTWRTA